MNKTNTHYEIWRKNVDGPLTVQERNKSGGFVWTDEMESYEAAVEMVKKWPACTLVVLRVENEWPHSESKRTEILTVGKRAGVDSCKECRGNNP
jgi:hypothetical protein